MTSLSDSASSIVSQHSLRIAGLLNLVGDVALLAEGLGIGAEKKEIQPLMVSMGALYTLGGLNLALFGSPDINRAQHELSHRIADFIEQETGELPPASKLANLCNDTHGMFEQCKNALASDPVQNTMALYTAGAAVALARGVGKYRESDKGSRNFSDLGYGASSLSLKLASYLIPEDNRQQAEPKKISSFKEFLDQNVIEWVKEKPLRLFGYGSFIPDAFMIKGTLRDINNKPDLTSTQKGIMGVKALSYPIADLLMAVSHKSSENNAALLNETQEREITELVEDVIAQHSYIDKTALRTQIDAFLSQQPELQQSSWAQRISQEDAYQHSLSL